MTTEGRSKRCIRNRSLHSASVAPVHEVEAYVGKEV